MGKFITRKSKKRAYKTIILIFLMLFGFIISIRLLFKLFINKIDENEINKMLALSTNNILGDINLIDFVEFDPSSILRKSLSSFNDLKPIKEKTLPVISQKEELIYIYNTHQTEEYNPGSLKEYNITPTVYMASHMLKEALKKKNIKAVVEERKLKEELNNKNLTYNDAYTLTYDYLIEIKEKYPTIKYFIDLHRDSVSASININDLDYAKMMFVIGMNHDNYKENEELMLKLNEDLNNNYPGIMRNVFYGKNSKYNQHFDNNVILIEVGGIENNINEVYNSINALASSISSVLGEQ